MPNASPDVRKGQGTYNVVVIGGGTAGLVTAAGTAGLGGRVALIEQSRMGGECLNSGCVPSKALIASARLIDKIRHASEWGLDPQAPAFRFDAIFDRMRRLREHLGVRDSQERFEGLGVDIFRGRAAFASPHEVRIGDLSLKAKNFVIASGSRPAVPAIEGLDAVRYYTNESIFDDLAARPERLVIAGGGPIGCELGQVFAQLGVRATIVQRPAQILEREDRDAADLVRRRLESDGVTILTGAEIHRVALDGKSIRLWLGAGAKAPALECDALLLAAGRTPNTQGLDLEKAGVAFTKDGIAVNDYLQTSQPHIYAAGDIVGPHRFTHVADHQARTVVRNILLPWVKAKWQTVIPSCTYTTPELARAGLNERQAREQGVDCETISASFEDVDRAVLDGAPEGFVRVLTPRGKDRILGVTIVGERAGDLLPEFVLAMKNGIGLTKIARTVHLYPTLSEIARKVADERQKRRLTPFARKVTDWMYRRQRGA
jgi:pyruvate/2-oxoglutarate dehydrogenase complex dihydrolipoamide dehydrogenase (E3) component